LLSIQSFWLRFVLLFPRRPSFSLLYSKKFKISFKFIQLFFFFNLSVTTPPIEQIRLCRLVERTEDNELKRTLEKAVV